MDSCQDWNLFLNCSFLDIFINWNDVWSVFGVTKVVIVIVLESSARTGSEDSHNEAYNIIYTVDSTSAKLSTSRLVWCK